jgi:hypothetical protein
MGTSRGARGRRALIALCVGLPVAEFILVTAAGVWTATPLAPRPSPWRPSASSTTRASR